MNTTALNTVRELLGGETFPGCQSASLRLEKFVRLGDNTKKAEIDAVVGKALQRIPPLLPRGAVRFSAKLGGRLIVNQAGGVLENAGLCIHPHFNVPYIPGSAVKGVARHAAWQAWNEAEEGEAKIEAAKDVAEVFGFPTGDTKPNDQEKVEPGRVYLDDYLIQKGVYKKTDSFSGNVAFLAAYPDDKAPLVADVVTCHHPRYYGGTEPQATDNEAPIPNAFPAVEKGARFVFTLASFGISREDVAQKARTFLIRAISEHGVGSKTAAGYGWFVYSDADDAEWNESIRSRAAEELKRRERTARKKEHDDAAKDIEGLIDGLDAINPGDSELRSAIQAIEARIGKLPHSEEFGGIDQGHYERLARIKKTLPAASPLDTMRGRWSGLVERGGLNAVINDPVIKSFANAENSDVDNEARGNAVRLLREEAPRAVLKIV